jgi:hypothetical protein
VCTCAQFCSSRFIPSLIPFTHLALEQDNLEEANSEKAVQVLFRPEVGRFFKSWDNRNVKFVLFIRSSVIQTAYARVAVSFTTSATFYQVPYFLANAK